MLHYEKHLCDQKAEWIVFLHGAGGSLKTWNYQIPAFREEYNLLLLDLRDHGNSPQGSDHTTYKFEIIASDIFEVLDHLGITKAIFMSLSFGSVLLQDISIRRPGLIQTSIMAGGIFKANFLIRSYVYLARLLNLILSYHQMYRLFSWLLMPGKNHQVSRRIYQMQARKLDTAAYLRWVSLYGEFFHLLDRFYNQTIFFPTMVIMGAQDYIFLTAAKKFVFRKTNNVNLQILENAGHICNIDQYEAFNKQVLNYLQELRP
jgi:pimeloyl-ACP methyl ester carboxylesterase